MNYEEILSKLEEEIKENNQEDLIRIYESKLTKNIKELSINENFFNLPLKNIFSIISKVDFGEIENNNENELVKENDQIIEIIRNIIKNTIQKHSNEKETILILQNINTTAISSLTYEDILSFLELITNCPLLSHFCQLYKEQNKLLDIDYSYELSLKEQEIENLKQEMLNLNKGFLPLFNKPNDYESDIFLACELGKLSSVRWLIEKENVSPKIKIKINNEIHKFYIGDSPLHIASKYNHLDIVKYLIEHQHEYKDLLGNFERTALYYSCEKGHLPIVKYLISIGADPNARDNSRNTCLHCSCLRGNLSIAQFLLSNGANANAKNYNGNYVIHCATIGNLLPIVQYLIEKEHVDKDMRGNNATTPLLIACECGFLPIIEYLISKGANIYAHNGSGKCSIHCATEFNQLSIIQYLIEKQNVNIDIKSPFGYSPLHIACQKGFLPIIEYLISKGANIEAKNRIEGTPLHCACENGHIQIIDFLISKGANIEAKNGHGKTPLHYAFIKKHIQTIEFLISKGANIQVKDKSGNSFIHYACNYGILPIVEYLIETKNVDVNMKGSHLRTPLHYACENGFLQIVEYLISKGADIEAKVLDDYTPLHIAVDRCKTDIVKCLLSHGANKYAKTKLLKTPYSLALNSEIKNLLM